MTAVPPILRKPEIAPAEFSGWLVADSEQLFRNRVAEIAETPFAFDDAKALRKAFRFIGADEGLLELESSFVIALEQAVQQVVLERRARNVAKQKAREARGFAIAQRRGARQLRERGR